MTFSCKTNRHASIALTHDSSDSNCEFIGFRSSERKRRPASDNQNDDGANRKKHNPRCSFRNVVATENEITEGRKQERHQR
jgi:hypothetical protein